MTPYAKLLKDLIAIDATVISVKAKYIYTLMLDRYSLSQKNQWIDADGNVYIYFTLVDIQKSIGVCEKTAVNVLKELENNGLITKKRQGQGKPSKIYLQDIENIQKSSKKYTKSNEKNNKKDISKSDNNNKLKNDTAKSVEKTLEISEEHKNEKKSEISPIIETFKRFFGREPDKSFKKTIQKRIQESNLKIATIKSAIEKAFQVKAKKPEAFILYLTQFNTYNEVQEVPAPEPAEDAPLNEDEIDWLLDLEYYKKRNDEEYSQARIDELEQMLEVIKQKKAEEDAKRPLEDWEIEWLNEQKRYEQSERESSENVLLEVPSYLLE